MREGERKELDRIERSLGSAAIAEKLEELSGADFNTLLLEVFRRRAGRLTAGELLKKYEGNRFVQPAAVDPIALKRLELGTLGIARDAGFAPLLLSPVAPLGCCSVVAPADQNKIVSALRGTEAVADATNLLALHICRGLKAGELDNRADMLRFATTHRHVRAQALPDAPGMFAHFHVFCLVTSGRDGGSYSFEKQAVLEHLRVYRTIFAELRHAEIDAAFNLRGGYTDGEGLVARVADHVAERAPDIAVKTNASPDANAYYKGLQFTLRMTAGGEAVPIGDGGFVDWSQQLLGNRKERMLISAIGLDRMLL